MRTVGDAMCRVYVNLRVRCVCCSCFLLVMPVLVSSYRRVRNARLVAPHDGCSPRAPARRTAGRWTRRGGRTVARQRYPIPLLYTGVGACPRPAPRGRAGALPERGGAGRGRQTRGGAAAAPARRPGSEDPTLLNVSFASFSSRNRHTDRRNPRVPA